jgi:glycosyltransferase 2 family protein
VKKKILTVLKYLVFLAIGGVLFWLAIRGNDINNILMQIRNADYIWIALAVVAMLFSHLVRALRWNQLLDTLNIKTKPHTTFYAVAIGYFVNNAVARLGEITRCGVLARHHKVPVNTIFGTVIAERAFDTLTMLIILLVTVLSQIYFLGGFIREHIIYPITSKFPSSNSALLIIGGGFVGVCLFSFFLYRLLLPWLRKLKLFHKIVDLIKGFWQGIKTIKNIKNKGLFIFYTLLMWGLYTLTTYICFKSIGATEQLTFIDALTIMAIGSIGTLVPTPGGIGAYQYFVTIALASLFIDHNTGNLIEKSTASAYANLIYFSQWLMINIVGGVSWVLLFLSDKRKPQS